MIKVKNKFSPSSYNDLLSDPRWGAKRKIILERDEHQCVCCASKQRLQVHHRQYHFVKSLQVFQKPWDYPNHYLITLCEPCHKTGHANYKVPTFNI